MEMHIEATNSKIQNSNGSARLLKQEAVCISESIAREKASIAKENALKQSASAAQRYN